MRLVSSVLLCFYTLTPVSAADPPAVVRIPHVTRPPLLDDFLVAEPATQAVKVTGFRQREPQDGAPVSQPTTAWLAHDGKNLYAVFVCRDIPGKVRAHLVPREDIGGEDTVGLYLDTFHDRHRAYLFESNALGVQRDSILTEGGKPDVNFDTVWHSEGRLTPEGYVVLMSIPFRSLRFARTGNRTWGIALTRSLPRNNEDSYWPYVTGRVQGFVQQLADAEGLDDISSGHNIQLAPYFTFARSRFLGAGPMLLQSNDARVGADGKVVFNDRLTLDFTVNPDFSQVESNDPQVTINQRYEVYFPEKRPFFLENSGFFETPTQLFFSRRIVDPEGGARLTGKFGPWALGFVATNDRAPGKQLPQGDSLYGHLAQAQIARIRREFIKQSYIGAFVSNWQFGSAFNRIISFDARFKLNDNWSARAQLVHSFDRKRDGAASSGAAYYGDALFAGRHLTYLASYTGRSPDFHAMLGFIQRVDMRQEEQYAAYRWRPRKGVVTSFGPATDLAVTTDYNGRVTDWSVNVQFDIEFRGPTHVSLTQGQIYENYLGRGYHKKSSGISFYTAPRKWFQAYGGFSHNDTVAYSPAYGVAPFFGQGKQGSFGSTFALRRLRLDQFYLYSRLSQHEIGQGGTVFNNHIARSKVNYQFTRALSIRAITDYYAVLPNESLVNQIHFKRVNTDLLLTYLLHPGTAIYAGFTNGLQNLRRDPSDPSSLGRMGGPAFLTDRLVFIKLSYLFRY